jgi:hypothetical protein
LSWIKADIAGKVECDEGRARCPSIFSLTCNGVNK